MKKLLWFFVASLILLNFSAPVLARSATNTDIHTWHNVTAENGAWKGRLVIASANEKGYFTDAKGNKIGQIYDFNLDTHKNFKYGFGFDRTQTDFNIAYTLTLYKVTNSLATPLFTSPACVFEVTAKSPANPDVRVEKFHGAKCQYVVTRNGENFFLG